MEEKPHIIIEDIDNCLFNSHYNYSLDTISDKCFNWIFRPIMERDSILNLIITGRDENQVEDIRQFFETRGIKIEKIICWSGERGDRDFYMIHYWHWKLGWFLKLKDDYIIDLVIDDDPVICAACRILRIPVWEVKMDYVR